jgi:hypothetical protein
VKWRCEEKNVVITVVKSRHEEKEKAEKLTRSCDKNESCGVFESVLI